MLTGIFQNKKIKLAMAANVTKKVVNKRVDLSDIVVRFGFVFKRCS